MRRALGMVGLSWVLACAHAPPAPVAPPPPPVSAQAPVTERPSAAAPAATTAEAPRAWALARLARMSLEEKVGQLMMVGFAGQTIDQAVVDLVRGKQVGGVCLFGRNLASAAQAAKLNDDLRALLGDVPPFIAVDQEGGNVVRIDDGNLVLPGNMLLGAARDPELAYEAGLAQGEDLRRLGFSMNLAPVLDVNSNPRNPVIGIRAFSDDAALVAELGARFVAGQQAAGLVTVAKHFPGHGAVEVDSHRSLPVLRATRGQVLEQLKPFAAAAKVGLDGMMTAHVAVPALSGDETPATLSPELLTDVLRTELRFDGLVLTDELEMDAIDHRYGVGQAAVLALRAGSDMVLVPWRQEKKLEVYEALLAAAKSGALPRERLDEAVRRVLETKKRRGLLDPLPPREARLRELGAKREVASRIARAGLTLLRQSSAFPLRAGARLAVVTPEASLAEALGKRIKVTEVLVVPAWPDPASRDELKVKVKQLAERAQVVVLAVTNTRQLELGTMVALVGRPLVVVVLGAPYLATQLREAGTVLEAYSYRASATEAAAEALVGEQGTPGRLPVALPGIPFGFRLDPVGERARKRVGLVAPTRAGLRGEAAIP